MATFKICVFKHQKREDGKYPVSIRLCWKRRYSYIKSEYYVTERQINRKNFTLKDIFIINELNRRIARYEGIKSQKLGSKIQMYTAKELADYFIKETKTGSRVFDFYQRYSSPHIFTSNVNKGLKVVAEQLGISEQLTTYYARHSWATIARNKCSISKDDIDLALNHVDNSKRMADVYIEKDWSIIDNANRAVIDFVFN